MSPGLSRGILSVRLNGYPAGNRKFGTHVRSTGNPYASPELQAETAHVTSEQEYPGFGKEYMTRSKA